MFYDVVLVVFGVVVDLSYIFIVVKVIGYGKDDLVDVLIGVDVVLILVGMFCKLGMDCFDLFNINVGIVKNLIEGVVDNCLNVCVGIIINLVNIIVVIVVEMLKVKGVYDKNKFFGVMIFDVICVEMFVVEFKDVDVFLVYVLVIGGYFGIIIFFFFL